MSKDEENLANQGNAALFNLTAAMMRKAGEKEWAFAVSALLSTVRQARAKPRSSMGMIVLEALQAAGSDSSWAACEEILAGKKDAGRAVVFPALMLAARYAHEMKERPETVVLHAIRGAMKQIGLAVDEAAFAAAEA
jgi:hypothetical protein